MTCDDKEDLPCVETQEKRNLKRKLDKQTFGNDISNPDYNDRSDTVNDISSELCSTISDSEASRQSSLVHQDQENTKTVRNKRKIVDKHTSRKNKKRLEIETEFKILQSLIPKIADKQTINEVRFKFLSPSVNVVLNSKHINI